MKAWWVTLALLGCGTQKADETRPLDAAPEQASALPEGVLAGTVVETMDAGGYTYALLDDGSGEVWVAGPQAAVQVGESLQAHRTMKMEGFHSKSLDRTFEVIWFAGRWGRPGELAEPGALPAGHPPPMDPGIPPTDGSHQDLPEGHPAVGGAAERNVVVPAAGSGELLEGVQDVPGVLRQGAALAGQTITVQGVVTKFNADIMGTNWVHLRPSADASEDLLITTDDVAAVGQQVQATGVVVADKDYGAGYRYDLVVEGARLQPVMP